MKDIVDKLSDSLVNTCKEAIGQTQKTLDQTRFRTELFNMKNDVKKLYQQLGEETYTNFMKNGTDDIHIPTCNRITTLLKEIERLEARLDEVVEEQKDSFTAYKRDVQHTWNENPYASADIKRDENGVKILKFCQHCNIGNPVEAVYCIHCGNKI